MRYFFLLVLTLVIASCAAPKGLMITDCNPRPASSDFLCGNVTSPNKIIMAPAKVDNWICISAADNLSAQKACQASTGFPKMNVCGFNAHFMQYTCWNEVTLTGSTLDFANSGGFICYSPVDEEIILDFCQKRAAAALLAASKN